jgi:hypothetical protein
VSLSDVQVREIRRVLPALAGKGRPLLEKLEVNSVDGFQVNPCTPQMDFAPDRDVRIKIPKIIIPQYIVASVAPSLFCRVLSDSLPAH